ncbi:MAG: hypothetical protein A3C43_07680 [Candidatus Schekmanbacteria bacterium RIFCSPHIGHO2_02_FULL_38_11]|uniref:Uncharacterized protein n=1 Tax=Candidatus Schekmanbacteria bacterium RIFCSPLOWO2_12_FULL_38_15 TaxID=1817883 RepID=A0A1F7SHS7_9BACT|nr:MAG: hypothetical protein A2043_11180 [Candidatus Schekmanbacteria bacterium GWA2_38_9]OGL48915.1 MAG: hypothetical protein A3C43_07680 [Candidatus Schekmanbacteria bacterium RIFCSPHIGHO2_02_FULL_38_11]OGL49876.1 MAG: hypothetical protein A3H37_09720 [Candidatus Schekmanbacteria bacterium RIFCSPLOWO2_02_FULL_38_14]OGL52784.1 MAG: hypothetical protein A3G31_00080 [Candidatus Schekmanbacteria bacterium RIFCSPLOWO2_12_FULL_38_15]
MKKNLFNAVIFLSLLTFILSGCFYYVQQPLDIDFSKTELGTKQGKASAYVILWFFAFGNAGSKAAADNGGLKIIRHADYKDLVFLSGLFAIRTTIVYGD